MIFSNAGEIDGGDEDEDKPTLMIFSNAGEIDGGDEDEDKPSLMIFSKDGMSPSDLRALFKMLSK